MTYRIFSEYYFILDSLVDILKELKHKNVDQHTTIVDDIFSELTKIKLRHLAQKEEWAFTYKKNNLNDAIQLVENDIQDKIPEFTIKNNTKNSLQSLNYQASELHNLAEELSKSKKNNRIGKRTILTENSTHEIIEIGLSESIEGLFAKPIKENLLINIEELNPNFIQKKGEWFPFEIYFNEFIYILDDDGTIYISTENYPNKLLYEARQNMTELISIIFNNQSHQKSQYYLP